DDNASGDRLTDERDRVWHFWSQRDQADATARCLLQTLEFVPVGSTDMLDRMSAAWSVLVRDVRPFEMAAGHHVGDERKFLARRGDRLETGLERFERVRDERRKQPRHAMREIFGDDARDV